MMISCRQPQKIYDIVIIGDRVIDPETHLDTIINLAILGDTIATMSFAQLNRAESIDGAGLVLAPG